MIINVVLLSLITIGATGNIVKTSSERSSSLSYDPEEDTFAAFSSSIAPSKPTRRPEPSLVDDGTYLHDAAFIPLKYFQIQYAPIPERFEKSAGVKQTTKIVAINFASTEYPPEAFPVETIERFNMKPNIAPYFDVQRQSYRSFVPGYNVEVLQSVNRNLGYSAMYKTYPELFEKKKKYKITFMGENVETHTPEHLVTQTIPTMKPFSYHVPSQNFVFKPNLINVGVEQAIQKVDRQNLPLFAKIRRIHLNLARVYSQGQGIPKLPSHDKDYSMNIRSRKKTLLPSLYPEAFIRTAQLMGDEKETNFHLHK